MLNVELLRLAAMWNCSMMNIELTWWLLNENDTNEINTDSTWSFVNTHCLCSVLKVESLYSFSPTIGKKAFIVLTYRKGARSSLLYIFIFKTQLQRFFSEIKSYIEGFPIIKSKISSFISFTLFFKSPSSCV